MNEEGDVGSSDDGSIVDRERNTWLEWCDSAFRNGLGTIPLDADGPHPMVFPDELCSDEVWADMSVSVCEEVPVLAFKYDLISQDERTDEVSGLSCVICGFCMVIRIGDTRWFCLLSSADAGGANDSDMTTGLGGESPDHWRGFVWDPGIVGQPCIRVCYDCLCLMALFRAVMLSVHYWAVWSVWTGTEYGYCRTITWELGYLRSLYTPCDVDRGCTNMAWHIKEYKGDVVAEMTVGNENNSLQRCAYVRRTSLGVLSAGRFSIMMIGRFGCGGGGGAGRLL